MQLVPAICSSIPSIAPPTTPPPWMTPFIHGQSTLHHCVSVRSPMHGRPPKFGSLDMNLARVCRPAEQPTIDPTHGAQGNHSLHKQSTCIGKIISSFSKTFAEKIQETKFRRIHPSIKTLMNKIVPGVLQPFAKAMIPDKMLSIKRTFMMSTSSVRLSIHKDTEPIPNPLVWRWEFQTFVCIR